VIFALDSIPAAFGVTTDPFLVFTSNAFAILGLRALYFVLAGGPERLRYLSLGLAVLLAFIGVKMMVSPVLHIPTRGESRCDHRDYRGRGGHEHVEQARVTDGGQAGTPVPAEPERRRSHV